MDLAAEAAFQLALEAVDAATEAAARVAGASAKLAQQSSTNEGRPAALAAAKTLAAVGSARSRIEAAIAAASSAFGEREAALLASVREEKGLRDQAAAMHAQRLALMEELAESRAAQAALVDAHAASEAAHATAVEELRAAAAAAQALFQTPDRLAERVQRARAANVARGLSVAVGGAAPSSRTGPLSPSDCAIEPMSDSVGGAGSSEEDERALGASSADFGPQLVRARWAAGPRAPTTPPPPPPPPPVSLT